MSPIRSRRVKAGKLGCRTNRIVVCSSSQPPWMPFRNLGMWLRRFASEGAGKDLTDESVQTQLIETAYNTHPEELSFDDWVKMKLPTLDKDE